MKILTDRKKKMRNVLKTEITTLILFGERVSLTVTSHAGAGTFSCGCPSGATGVPLYTKWDPVAGPGRTPMPRNKSGLTRLGQ